MTLRVYNTLSQQKELFQTVRPGKVGMYLCGPTVYKSPHVGHMVGPVIFDAVKRYLTFKGYEVTFVVNITDVDDKLIDAAARLNTTVKELAEKHTAEYFECLAALGVNSIDHFPRATAHIPEIVDLCRTLIGKGYAYAAEGNVWFDVAKDADYGKLSHRHVEEQEAGGRGTEAAGKRGPADFGLWKAAKPGEVSWDSPWGKGRPGWHIECSAMSMKILGPSFDIHGGGLDLMFPHHENELAQSESATDQPFARYWVHNGLTRLNTKKPGGPAGGGKDAGAKDAKPAGGGEATADAAGKISGSAMWTEEGAKVLASVAARKLIADHGPEVLRYLLLSTHYRRPIEFSDLTVADTKKALATFARLFERMDRVSVAPAQPPAPVPSPPAAAATPAAAPKPPTVQPAMGFAPTPPAPAPGAPAPQGGGHGGHGGGEDMDRAAAALMEGEHAAFAKAVLALKMKFLEMMDDDFNTAGAIAALHEMAGEVNAFLEHNDADKSKPADVVAAAAAAVRTLKGLGGVLGLFQPPAPAGAALAGAAGGTAAAAAADGALSGKLMDLLIKLRADARAGKNFALADDIRKGLMAAGVTIEDGPEGTRWRKS
jgi:cysteinyl-tRNA synthetase